MNREGDVNFSLAFDAGITYSVVLEDTAPTPVPIDVTGYSARMQLRRYDGSRYGALVAELLSGAEITVGTTDGLFEADISTALATTIGALFGGVPPREPLRYRFFATPPAGTEVEIAHGGISLLEAGETIAPVTATVQSVTNTIVVSALATTGPAGPPGPIVPVTYSTNGAMISTDKRNHDTVWESVVYIPPSGDTTGSTDVAAVNAAIAANKSVRWLPGQYYADSAFNFQSAFGLALLGAGPRLTKLDYVGARMAGFALFRMYGAVNCEVSGIEIQGGLAHRIIHERISPNQAKANKYRNLHLYGPPSTITATSTVSLTITEASKTVTGLSTAAFPQNTQVWLGSRGCGSWMSGLVTSTSGDLVFTADHAYEDPTAPGARTDWDIRQPPLGIYLEGTADSLVEHVWFNRTLDCVDAGGSYSSQVRQCWHQLIFGVPYHLSASASKAELDLMCEPSYQGWQTTLRTTGSGSQSSVIKFNTGDGAPFGAFLELTNDSAPKISGTFRSDSGVPLIKMTGCESPTVENVVAECAGSYLVDFGSGATTLSPTIHKIKYLGSTAGPYTGTSVARLKVDNVLGEPYITKGQYAELISGYVTTSTRLDVGNGSTEGIRATVGLGGGLQVFGMFGGRVLNKSLVNGSNVDVGIYAPHNRLIGPTTAFTVHGFENGLVGQQNIVVVDVAQVMTLKHLSGTESFAARRMKCPGGVDLISDGSSLVAFRLVHNGTNWDVYPIYGFTPRATNQNLGFSATLATLTGETKTATLSCAAIVGDNVQCNPRGALPDGVHYHAWISAANTVSVRVFNASAGNVDLSAVVWDFTGRAP